MTKLKYWKIVKYWIKQTHQLTEDDLDALLFIYEMKPFTKSEFGSYDNVFVFQTPKINRLIQKGLLVVFREKTRREAAKYVISERGNKICKDVYAILAGKKRVPMIDTGTFTSKVYKTSTKQLMKNGRVPTE